MLWYIGFPSQPQLTRMVNNFDNIQLYIDRLVDTLGDSFSTIYLRGIMPASIQWVGVWWIG